MNNNDENKINNKPINRIATPIKLDKNGERIDSVDNPVILTAEEKQEKIKEKVIKEKNKKIEEHDPTTAIFIVILLIIFAILAAFICLYVVPRYLDSQNYHVEYNDKDKVIVSTKKVYPFTKYTLLDTVYVDTANTFDINDFKIELEYNGTNFNVIINGTMLIKADYVLPNVAIVDDLLLIATQNEALRTTRLFAVDINGVVMQEWHQIGDTEGMVLLPDSSSIVFNSVNIVLLGSRVTGKNLILDKKLGNTEGLDLCNADVMGQYGIDDSFKVMGTYSIEYLGGHKFSDPKLLHSTSISDYKTVNNLCY